VENCQILRAVRVRGKFFYSRHLETKLKYEVHDGKERVSFFKERRSHVGMSHIRRLRLGRSRCLSLGSGFEVHESGKFEYRREGVGMREKVRSLPV
jgi:hypothetical protein